MSEVRPRSARHQLRRRDTQSPKVPRPTTPAQADSAVDGDFVVLKEIRQKRLKEREKVRSMPLIKEDSAIEALKNSNLENSLASSSLSHVTERISVLVPDEQLTFLRQRLFKAVLTDTLDQVAAIVNEIENNNLSVNNKCFLEQSSSMNILHYAIENDKYDVATHLIKQNYECLMFQEYDVIVKGKTTHRNALQLITLKGSLALAELFINRIGSEKKYSQLLYTETSMEITGQRPRTFPCLHIAAFMGFEQLTKYYLDLNVPVNHLNGKNDTALLWASRWGHIDVIKLLIKRGADANIENDKGSTALYWAVRYNLPEAVKLLAEEGGADVKKQRKVGLIAPIVLASALGYSEIVEILLNNGEDVNLEIRGGETALHHAAREGSLEVAEILIKRGATVDEQDERGDTPLTIAAKASNDELLELLLASRANIKHKNHEGSSVWHYALSDKDNRLLHSIIRFICKSSASEIKKSQSDFYQRKPPLCIAASLGATDKIDFLLSMGLNPQEKDDLGNNVLHYAAMENHSKVIQLHGQQIGVDTQNENKDTPLHIACLHGYDACIDLLLEHKAKADIRNSRGETALHVLARSLNSGVARVKRMINYVISNHSWDSLHTQDKHGNNALHVAARHSSSSDILWEFRVLSFKQVNYEKNNPLHCAVRAGSPEILDTMLDIYESMRRDADINSKNSAKETVFHLAALEGDIVNMKRLIRYGADLSAQDEFGDTPLHMLISSIVEDPANIRRYMAAIDTILDEAARWLCIKEETEYPDEDTILFSTLKRKSILYLISRVINTDCLSALGIASKLGCKEALEKLLMIPEVNLFVDGPNVRLDLTDLTPFTRSDKWKHRGSTSSVTSNTRSISCFELLVNMNDPRQAGTTFDVPVLRQVEAIYENICAWWYAILILAHIIYISLFSGLSLELLHSINSHGNASDSFSQIETAMYVIVPTEPAIMLLFSIYTTIKYLVVSYRKSKALRGNVIQLFVKHFSAVVTVIYASIVITWVVLYSVRYQYQDYFLALALWFGWLYTISFTRGFRPVHYFWRMLRVMIVRDVVRFLFVYFFVLLAFSFAIHAMIQISSVISKQYSNPVETIFTIFNLMLGMVWIFEDAEMDREMQNEGRSSAPIKVVHVLYVILSTIILLNVLIAMMNDSYQHIKNTQSMTWRVDSVRLGLDVDSVVPWAINLFNRVRIYHGDIVPESNPLDTISEISDSSFKRGANYIINDDSDSVRWFIIIPLTNIRKSKGTWDEREADTAQHIRALTKQTEKLERLMNDLQQDMKNMKHTIQDQ